MDMVKQRMMEMEYTDDTRRLYAMWIVRYIHFNQKRHPAELGQNEIERFLEYLAVKQNLSASSCNQALTALKFLYQTILGREIHIKPSKRRHSIPQTASRPEIELIISKLAPKYQLMAFLCYGAGVSIGECVRLKVSDIDIDNMEIAMGGRSTVLPEKIVSSVQQQINLARFWPGNSECYLFPSCKIHHGRCWFVSESSLQKAMKKAASDTGLSRQLTPKILRHSFIRHLLQAGYNARTVQNVAGFASVKSVMVYQRMNDMQNVISPLENIRKK